MSIQASPIENARPVPKVRIEGTKEKPVINNAPKLMVPSGKAPKHKAVMDKQVANIASSAPFKRNSVPEPVLLMGENNHFNVECGAFKDALGRNCHIITPKGKDYDNFHDFIQKAPKQEKLDLFKMIETLGKDAGGFKFIVETKPETQKMRMYLASAKDVKIPDVRWENIGETYNGKAGSKKNNPLFEKSQSGLTTTLDESEHFVRFTTPKPNHDLICPKQEYGHKDIMKFIKKAPDEQKLELLDMIAKNAEPNNKIYVNSGRSRRIPWMHVHMLYSDKSKKP